MRVLVTGAGGWIGGRLVQHLLHRDAEVRAVTRTGRAWPTSVDARVADVASSPADVLADLCEGVDAVVHLAGLSEVVAAEDPGRALEETVRASRRLGQAAAGVARFLYLSTFHVYGRRASEGIALDEDVEPDPVSVYGQARLESERLLTAVLPPEALTVLRLTNAVGAPADVTTDRWTLVANDLARSAVLTGSMTLRSDGQQTRDFVALADVVQVLAVACDRARLPGGIFNLGSGKATSIRDLAFLVQDEVERRVGARPGLVAPDASGPPPAPVRVDVRRLAEHDLRATTSLREAVAETVDFCVDHRDALSAQREQSP